MSQEQQDRAEAVANDVSGEAMNVVQAGRIDGDVNIGAPPNFDIGVILRYESDDVNMVIGRDKILTVEIFNRRESRGNSGCTLRGAPRDVAHRARNHPGGAQGGAREGSIALHRDRTHSR